MGETTVPANPTVCCLCLWPEQAKPSLHETGTSDRGAELICTDFARKHEKHLQQMRSLTQTCLPKLLFYFFLLNT